MPHSKSHLRNNSKGDFYESSQNIVPKRRGIQRAAYEKLGSGDLSHAEARVCISSTGEAKKLCLATHATLSCRFLSAVGTGWRQVSEDLRRHRLRELGAASRTELPHALRSDLAVETEHLSLEGNCGGDRPQTAVGTAPKNCALRKSPRCPDTERVQARKALHLPPGHGEPCAANRPRHQTLCL